MLTSTQLLEQTKYIAVAVYSSHEVTTFDTFENFIQHSKKFIILNNGFWHQFQWPHKIYLYWSFYCALNSYVYCVHCSKRTKERLNQRAQNKNVRQISTSFVIQSSSKIRAFSPMLQIICIHVSLYRCIICKYLLVFT